ncbi:MAG: MFS transporter [Proteobacteria bacterium]|nr:MFS transporter [Pseudomonadota bacterium]
MRPSLLHTRSVNYPAASWVNGSARVILSAGALLGAVAMLLTPSAAERLTGTTLFMALLGAQVLLGSSQGPLFPVSAGALQSWFPKNRWALSNGLQTAAMNVGGAITPLLIVLLSRSVGWQGALRWIAVPTILVAIAWYRFGRDCPQQHGRVSSAELAELETASNDESRKSLNALRMRWILMDSNVVRLAAAYLCMNFVYYLISFWAYLYLIQVRHFQGIDGGLAGMWPWLGAALGAGSGGYLADRLAHRVGPRWGYRIIPLVMLPAGAAVLFATTRAVSDDAAVMTLTFAFFAMEITEGSFWAATMQIARSDTAAATGVLNTGGNLGGIVCQPAIAYLASNGAWNGAFVAGTLFAVLAAALWLGVDPEARLRGNGRAV